jgi:N,N'-diacetyllegionaminate synthase
MSTKTIIIAEAGVNHNGDLAIAKKLVDVAAEAGADYIKFQTFKAEKLVTKSAAKAQYQQENNDAQEQSQLAMLRKLELSYSMLKELVHYCKTAHIRFLSTAFDKESVDFLHGLDLDFVKVPSGEITNRPYLERVGSFGKKVILSTGMSDMQEIEDALDILTTAGTAKSDITVLHCNSEYPTPMEDVNLRAMQTIADTFQVDIGYSDHTEGIEVSLAAVALGARVIEKHFTLDKKMKGPDHRASLEPAELQVLVSSIRNLERAMGSARKSPTPSEIRNMSAVRKSIHLNVAVEKGHIFSLDDLVMKRPGDGISPMRYTEIIGKAAVRDLQEDHQLGWEDLA